MSQSVLFLAIHLLGLAVCLAVGPRRVPALSSALAFPIGLVVTVLLALTILLVRAPYGPWTLGPAMAATATLAAIAAARRSIERRDVVVAARGAALFTIACLALTHFNIATFTGDSHSLLTVSFAIANADGFTPYIMEGLDRQGVFQIVAHTTFEFTQRDFLYSLPLVLGVAFVPAFALTLWHGLEAIGAPARRRSALVALVTAALFTIGMVDWHISYIHTNLGAGVYLFGYVVLFWLGEVRRDADWLPLAFLSLIAFALHRIETPLVALLFLAFTVPKSDLPRRTITGCLAVFTAILAIWYESLAQYVTRTDFLTPTRCRVTWILLVGFFLWWLASGTRFVRRIDRLVPALVAGGCAVAVVAAFAIKPAHMLRSSRNWVSNLIDLPHWGDSWFFIGALLLLSLALKPPPRRQAFAIGLPAYFAFVLFLSYFRLPYRIGLVDSANRMTIHVLALIVFYIGIKVIPALTRERSAETPEALRVNGS